LYNCKGAAAGSIPISEERGIKVKAGRTFRRRGSEAGIALLIAIFVLLLIGVAAIALIVSSGTETALAGNYRASTSVYYAAVAGLEEVRARLRSSYANAFVKTAPSGFLPAAGTPFPICNPSYVLNPLGSETVAPWTSGSTYADNEYGSELGAICGSPFPTSWHSTSSIWQTISLSFPGPQYKWVRINGVSEQSLQLDVDGDTLADSSTPLYYNGASFSNSSSSGTQVFPQVLEVTALAVLPSGNQQPTQKLVQYLIVPVPVTLPPFLAALTISGSPGNSPVFLAPTSNHNTAFAIKGDGDQDCSGNPLPAKVGIGLFGDYSGSSYSADLSGIVNGIPLTPVNLRPSYTGIGSAPDVEYLSAFPTNLQTPSSLDAPPGPLNPNGGIVQQITQSADAVLPSPNPPTYPLPTVTYPAVNSLGMSPANPLTVVINGNLDLSGWTGTGYGLLLVIGQFTYDPSSSWNGIILVIGQGTVGGAHMQYQQINGAMLVAKTRSASGSLLTGRIGGGTVSFDDEMQGNGIRYNSCWIQKSQPTAGYKVLSFHEIAQ